MLLSYKIVKRDKIILLFFVVGYSCNLVLINVYLGFKVCGLLVGSGSYDFDLEFGMDWIKWL